VKDEDGAPLVHRWGADKVHACNPFASVDSEFLNLRGNLAQSRSFDKGDPNFTRDIGDVGPWESE
jgi:hypothetical protein